MTTCTRVISPTLFLFSFIFGASLSAGNALIMAAAVAGICLTLAVSGEAAE